MRLKFVPKREFKIKVYCNLFQEILFYDKYIFKRIVAVYKTQLTLIFLICLSYT